MLRKEQNELTDPDRPRHAMGQLFRSYWMPVLLAEELPEDDCPPVRVKILSERLLAFRDSNGKYGLIDEFCAHRGVSLWFGRNEEGGLRCPYHGWKYDVNGQCMEVPSEPAESGFCKKVKLTSYPLVKRGEVLWAYMGPADKKPPLPEWEFAMVRPEQTFVSKRLQECNWLQAMEGGIDSSHVSFLHRGDLGSDPLFKGAKGNQYNLSDMQPHFEVVEQPGGLFIGARRNAENGKYYWRITPWVMPCFTMIPPRGDHPIHGHFWVPIDDENCWAWSYDFHPVRALSKTEVDAMKDGAGVHCKVDAAFRPLANKDNDYLIDRAAQKTGRTYQRRRRLRHAGRLAAGKHGPGLRPHQGKPGLDRQRHHHGAASPDARRQGAGRQRRDAARHRRRAPESPLLLGGAAARRGVQGRRQGSALRQAGHGADDGVAGAPTASCAGRFC